MLQYFQIILTGFALFESIVVKFVKKTEAILVTIQDGNKIKEVEFKIKTH